MKKHNGEMIDWTKNIPLARMFRDWKNTAELDKIRILQYKLDFGTEEVSVTYSLN